MSEINAKIIKLKIISANIIVSRRPLKRLEVSVECRAKLKTPGEEDNKSVLLNIELSVGAKNDDLKIHVSEWSSTISNRNILNDSCYKGAYIMKSVIDCLGKTDVLGYRLGTDIIAEHMDNRKILLGGSQSRSS